jgi:hypothetical protein
MRLFGSSASFGRGDGCGQLNSACSCCLPADQLPARCWAAARWRLRCDGPARGAGRQPEHLLHCAHPVARGILPPGAAQSSASLVSTLLPWH